MNFESVVNDLLGIPKAMLKCLKFYLKKEGSDLLTQSKDFSENKDIKRVVLIGHSYNYYASMVLFYYLNARAQSKHMIDEKFKKRCQIIEIDEFLTYCNPNIYGDDTIFIFVSRSGETVQIKKGINKLKNAGINPNNIWGIGNNQESHLAKESKFYFPIQSGEEEVIGTKSYVNTVLMLYIIGRSLLDKEALNAKREEEIRQLIFEIKFYGQDWEYHTKKIMEFLGEDYKFLYFISKGASMATAMQAALNCKAFTRSYAEGISLGLFMHGPYQIVNDSFRCVLVIGDEKNVDYTITLIDLITKKLGKGKVILINNSRNLSSLGRGNPNVYVFEHTTKNAYLAPIFEIISVQYLLLRMAENRGVIS